MFPFNKISAVTDNATTIRGNNRDVNRLMAEHFCHVGGEGK